MASKAMKAKGLKEEKAGPKMTGTQRNRPAAKREKKPPSLPATESLNDTIEACRTRIKEIIDELKEKGSAKYVDPDFRASTKSVFLNGKTPRKGNNIPAPSQWLRVGDICGKKAKFMHETSIPSDIIQGAVSDCWLLGGLASVVANSGKMVNELFIEKNAEYGLYAVRFFLDGDWDYVIIDDYIPCDVNGKPIFARCSDPEEYWIMLLEKSFARVYGSYEAIHFGFEKSAMESLTGGVFDTVDVTGADKDTKVADAAYKTLQTRLDEGAAYAASIPADRDKAETKAADGLFSGHAYGLLKAQDLKDGKTQLIQLNNPWGSGEYKGPYAPKSKEMTDAVATELAFKKGADDGLFWIPKADFFKRYGSIEGVRLFDASYKCVSTRSKIAADNVTEQAVSFAVVPETQTQMTIVVAQRDRRRLNKGEGDEYPVGIGFRVMQTDNPADIYEGEPKTEVALEVKAKFERSVVGTLSLDPGFGYYILPFFEVAKDAKLKKKIEEFQVYVRGYSKASVAMEELGYNEDDEEAEDVEEEDEEGEEEEEEEGEDE